MFAGIYPICCRINIDIISPIPAENSINGTAESSSSCNNETHSSLQNNNQYTVIAQTEIAYSSRAQIVRELTDGNDV